MLSWDSGMKKNSFYWHLSCIVIVLGKEEEGSVKDVRNIFSNMVITNRRHLGCLSCFSSSLLAVDMSTLQFL